MSGHNNDAELIGKSIPERRFYHHRTLNPSTMNMSRDLAFQHVRGLTEPKIANPDNATLNKHRKVTSDTHSYPIVRAFDTQHSSFNRPHSPTHHLPTCAKERRAAGSPFHRHCKPSNKRQANSSTPHAHPRGSSRSPSRLLTRTLAAPHAHPCLSRMPFISPFLPLPPQLLCRQPPGGGGTQARATETGFEASWHHERLREEEENTSPEFLSP